MADLPAAPSSWLDFSQGYVNGQTRTMQNLGHIGGTWSANGGSWKPTICGGVWDLENTAITTGNYVELDAGAGNATADAFYEQIGTVDYTLTIGFAFTGAFTVKQNFTYLLASSVLRNNIFNNTTGLNYGNGFQSTDASNLVDGRFYILIITNSWTDGFTRARIYDTVGDAYVGTQNFGDASTFNRNVISYDASNRIARLGSDSNGANSLPAYIGHMAHWEQGMDTTQMDSVVDYYKHKYAPRPTIFTAPSANFTDIETANYGVTITQTTNNSTADYTGNYNTVDVQVNGVTNKRLYVGFKNTASRVFYGDLPVSHIQIIQSNGTSFRTGSIGGVTRAYDFSLENNSLAGGLWRHSSTFTSSDIASSTFDPSTSFTYTNALAIGATKGIWTLATDTGSSYVGAAGGTYGNGYTGLVGSNSGGSILPSNSTGGVSQVGSSYYAFVECNGFSNGNGTFMRTNDTLTVSNGDIIRICYVYAFTTTRSDGLQNLSGTLFLRFA